MNIARIASLRAGLPVSSSAMTVNRFCSSGLQTIALAAERIMAGQGDVAIAGGAESMSMIPMGGHKIAPNPWLMDNYPDTYLNMGLTAENVAKKYGITREEADAFSYASHQKALAAIAAGKFKDEIVPVEVNYISIEGGANGSSNGAKPKTQQNRLRHGRRPPRRYVARSAREAQARVSRARRRHGREQFTDERRGRSVRRDER